MVNQRVLFGVQEITHGVKLATMDSRSSNPKISLVLVATRFEKTPNSVSK